MVNASIISYLRKYKDQYDISTLRSFLIQQGYNPLDVEQAIRVVTIQKKKVPTKILVGMVAILLILLSIYFFWPSQKLELFLDLSIEKTTFFQTESISFSASLGTNSNDELEGRFYYVLLDEKGNKLSENFDYVKLAKFKKNSFPLNTKEFVPGKYYLEFTFSLEGKEISDSLNFEIKQTSIIAPVQKVEESCPYSCDDNNPYTDDVCINNKCVNTPTNTCGNGVCDVGESTLSCSQDCAPEKEITGEDLAEKALELAASNPEKAANTCLQLTVGYDECLKKLNEKTNNSEFCNAVINSKLKDDCYSDHAMRNNDFNVCHLIVNSLKQRACINLKKLG